jgi:hypothetical protein
VTICSKQPLEQNVPQTPRRTRNSQQRLYRRPRTEGTPFGRRYCNGFIASGTRLGAAVHRTMALGSTLPLAEMSTRNILGGGGQGLTTSPPPLRPTVLDYMRASTSHNAMGLHSLLREWLSLLYVGDVRTSQGAHVSTVCCGDSFTFLYVDDVRTSQETPVGLHCLLRR